MTSRAYKPARAFLASLTKGDDLLAGIEMLCREHKVSCGHIAVIGSVSHATLAFYDQSERSYRTMRLARPLEIVSGMGNVSTKDGRPFCHVHLTLADNRGRSYGGHLVPGTPVFAAEVHLIELAGPAPERFPDEGTGLNLWRFP